MATGKVDDNDEEKMRRGNGGTMKPTTMRKGKGAQGGHTQNGRGARGAQKGGTPK